MSLLDAFPLFSTPSPLGPISIPKMPPPLCALAHSGRTVAEEKLGPFCSLSPKEGFGIHGYTGNSFRDATQVRVG